MPSFIQTQTIQATAQEINLIQDFLPLAVPFCDTTQGENKEQNEVICQLIEQKHFYLFFVDGQLHGCFAFSSPSYETQLTQVYYLPSDQEQEVGIENLQHPKSLFRIAIQEKASEAGFKYLTVLTTPKLASWYAPWGAKQSKIPSPSKNTVAYYLTVINQPWVDLPTAGLVCVKENQLLLAFSKNKQAWYLPGGKIDAQEDSQEALKREIEEELSLVLQPDRLSYLTHIVAPAYGEKKNILMQQDCYKYELDNDTITIANEIGGVQYFTKEEYIQHQIPVPGVLKVFEFLFG
ncbi:NUDIX hydrolase [Myroides fluvii]|uniref:NUDIX hydrolase n=1 Tax=Myroides fluvii TaxID=2572594 RepID=UPI00131E6D0F|nr:NUDIX domain-containing protein [Myroides fluvii]